MATKSTAKQIKEYTYPVINMDKHLQEMKNILLELGRHDVVNRIWKKAHTVWKLEQAEITNRLGWLYINDTMSDRIKELEDFAVEAQLEGFHHVVLLGMGGSSLGPEVLKQSFGNSAGYPPLIVLDSTHSASIEAVVKGIEPRHTLFLVSSKSGTTTETMSLYRYFHCLVNSEVGEEKVGLNFVAVTDEGTLLSRLAQETGFRRAFINPSDIGGRYSVLSYFGLLPAALTGIDIATLLKRAERMQESCAPCVDIYENPGVWLGALIGKLALQGRDKLTFVISPSVRSFGLWVEQLLAESTGKEGKGIVPVIDEPLVGPEYYGDDRLFVYLRMKGDKNAETDEAVMRLEVSGQPIIQLEVDDQYDLGGEFFRWEFATAVAGAVLGINPFDQPDVESTKVAARELLKEFQKTQHLPHLQSCDYPDQWLGQAKKGDYLAIMAYLKQTPAVDRALAEFRERIIKKYHIATTLGYGPRFLHSTGQLHKGGPDKGLFLQLTTGRQKDISIPGEPGTFNTLTEAEAQGDYRALESKGKKVTRIQLCSGSGAAIQRLARELVPE